MNFLKRCRITIRILRQHDYNVLQYSTSKNIRNTEFDKIRNIGILAHIDAGKTTTTERMLYYAGLIHQMGEVHHGNTVTDYMEQERERGITITSAAITFYWRNHQFNLIDTPGHIDFTMEVEQTLRIMDGAVVILDGSAGVEAQTLTVWRQAERYHIPRIIYVNKMDRKDANITMTCNSIEKKLQIQPLLLQLPAVENGKLVGIIDILTMELLNYDQQKSVTKTQLTEGENPTFWKTALLFRSKLIDNLTSHDDDLADLVIKSDSLDNIATADVVRSLQKVTEKESAVPVLLGSSYKNIGVQSLMDAVILYLPAPNRKNQLFAQFEDHICARAFKVIHDKQRGPLVFFRVYNGKLKTGQKIYNIQQKQSEQIGKLYIAYADDFKEVEEVDNGYIVVGGGLKKTNSGDLVTSSITASQRAKANIMKKFKGVDELEVDKQLGLVLTIPEPVFFCSIEPPSLHTQKDLDKALNELQREDSSLRVSQNTETGQTILAGMGELHLEIIRDRILKEYRIEADLGPFQIAYRESPIQKVTDTLTLQNTIGNTKQFVSLMISLHPCDTIKIKQDLFKLDKTPEYAGELANIFSKHLIAIKQGVEVGLSHGPKVGCPVVNVQVMLHQFESKKGTSESMITAATTQLIQKLLKKSGTDILEPIMHLEIVVPEEYSSVIMADLSRRRAIIKNVGIRGLSKELLASIPLSECLGYSTILRTLSSGTATFTMEFEEYEKMSVENEAIAILNVQGFL